MQPEAIANASPGARRPEPTLSIITPSFNQGLYIEQTIQSVLRQDHGRVEHIVVDGGSTDDTVAILKRYPHLRWISEPDRGQADALNKGLAMVTGDYVGWINSDDYYQPCIFGSVMAHFSRTGARWIVGNLALDHGDGTDSKPAPSPVITRDALIRDPDIVRQQPAFFKRKALVDAGGWNEKYYMAMDFDLWMRLTRVGPPVMVDEDWARFRIQDAQKSTHANILRQSAEITEILVRESAAPILVAAHRARKRWYWSKGVVKQGLIHLGVLPPRFRNRPLRPR